jgi:hypothetical protein
MKTNKIKQLIKSIVTESLEMMESHQQGNWWIDNAGRIQQNSEKGRDENDLMQNDRWKKISATKDKITVTTWDLKAEDLRIILAGIKQILGVEDPIDDPDVDIGKDGYSGPRIDLILHDKKKSFKNVPLPILQRCMPSNIKNYEVGKNPDLTAVNEAKSFHHLHKEYRMYEGDNHIYAIFEDGSRLVFEVHFHNNRGEKRDKWRRKAFSKWKSIANEIHNDVQLNETGNPIEKSWKQAFAEALEHPDIQEFIRNHSKHQSVFDSRKI